MVVVPKPKPLAWVVTADVPALFSVFVNISLKFKVLVLTLVNLGVGMERTVLLFSFG
jgi:hypothetical protein